MLTVTVGDDSLTPETVAAVARGRSVRPVCVDPAARERMLRSAAHRRTLTAARRPLYGVTTGFGDRNISQIAPERAAALQTNLIRYHLVGTGPDTPPDVVRAAMLLRANALARGWSGVRPEVVEALLTCVDHDLVPRVPQRGSVGASGDLIPLSYLAALLLGDGEAVLRGRPLPATDGLAACGLRPLRLEPKEGLALVNGTSFTTGYAALALADAADLATAAEAATALAVEAVRGNPDHYAPEIHHQKPHPGQVASAQAIQRLLAGSELCRDSRDRAAAEEDLGQRGQRLLGAEIQDRYSLRCAPHVIGVLRDTIALATAWLTTEINSSNDNPLFAPQNPEIYHGGNFYAGHVALAMDTLKVAVASVGDLLDRQLALVVDARYSNGLPPGLVRSDEAGAGLHHGFKGVQICCSAVVAEALQASTPSTVFSRSTESHNQDKVSMATIAARGAATVIDLVGEATALHLAALAQAADLRGPHLLAPGTRAVHDVVRAHTGPLTDDRRLDREIAKLVAALRERAVTHALENIGD